MRMRFPDADERAYRSTRDELCAGFAAWAPRHAPLAEPSNVELLLDWKYNYGDADLGRWTAADVQEFLVSWCPRKVIADEDVYVTIPDAVPALVAFLDERGLLSPDSLRPDRMTRVCRELAPRFLAEMADPPGGGADPLDVDAVQELLDAEHQEPRIVGPVRLPDRDEQLSCIRSTGVLRRVREFAGACAAPGLKLTARGNLNVADARRLADELRTGDDTDRTVKSSRDLSGLTALVELARAAGAVRRRGDRLVGVRAFAALDDVDAYRKIARVALADPAISRPRGYVAAMEPLHEFLHDGVVRVLVDVLDAHAAGVDGVEPQRIMEFFAEVSEVVFTGLTDFARAWRDERLLAMLDRMVDLGLLAPRTDGPADCACAGHADRIGLTPAGIPVAAELVAEAPGLVVAVRPDPATADADELTAALLLSDRESAETDLVTWYRAQPDAGRAAEELLAAVAAPERAARDVLAGLDLAGDVLGGAAERAARGQLDGPHDPLVVAWLLTRGVLDPAAVGQRRVLSGTVAVAGVFLDVEGPREAVDFLGGLGREGLLSLLDQAWRLDHPRTPEVLEAVGAHHPDQAVAKAARKNLMRLRSRAAGG